MSHSKKRILVIDDDDFFIKLMEITLKQHGYIVLLAMQGKQAIEILNQETVDLIIVDLMMPELDGLGFLHWLRQEAKSNTPALVQTGMVIDSIEQKAKAAGATAFIHKPVKIPELLKKIKQLEAFI